MDAAASQPRTNTLLSMIALSRPRQWVKNVFVLAPLFFGADFMNAPLLLQGVSAFLIFCLTSTAVYIFNDWRDIEADRLHVKKKRRPLPSGLVSVPVAMAVLATSLAAAVTLAAISALPTPFYLVLGLYGAANIAYSLGLKHIALVELFIVAAGFVLRLVAGAEAMNIPLSSWIIAATGMIALLLAVGKRRSDIVLDNDAQMKRRSLSGYTLPYLDVVLAILTSATLVVYLLFCISGYAQARYGRAIFATAIPVMFGLLRYIQLVMVYGRGDAPTELVLKDKGLIATVIVFVTIYVVLIYR